MTDTAVDEFLSVDGSGPEYAALRRLLERPLESGDRARPAEPGGMKKAPSPCPGAAYRVMPLSGGTFGVEVVIPDTDPTMVSGFATEAAARAWVATHRSRQATNSRPRSVGDSPVGAPVSDQVSRPPGSRGALGVLPFRGCRAWVITVPW